MKRDGDEITTASASAVATKKPKKSSKNLLGMIIEAIRSEKKPDGSSRIFIKKYLNEQYNRSNENQIKKALTNGVATKELIANKASFKVVGDAEYEVPADEKIRCEDIKLGDESEVAIGNGDTVFIDYIGSRLIEDDNSYLRFETGKMFEFIVGNKDVIKGMDMGLVGMKLNGERNVFIPSKLGYGKKGSGPDLPPNSDLKFNIKVKKIGQFKIQLLKNT